VSEKTAIDLETLGAPGNDSEGVDCYISEKGIQAAPKQISEEKTGTGKYIGKMYLCGTTYHVFEKIVFDEKMEEAAAHYNSFNETFAYEEKEASTAIPENYFEYKIRGDTIDGKRPVKTISYMTCRLRNHIKPLLTNSLIFSIFVGR
jgi:hypothetical protein